MPDEYYFNAVLLIKACIRVDLLQALRKNFLFSNV